eukprot:scaffold90922_cov75-Phaeocystis_antarctica.AAC.1
MPVHSMWTNLSHERHSIICSRSSASSSSRHVLQVPLPQPSHNLKLSLQSIQNSPSQARHSQAGARIRSHSSQALTSRTTLAGRLLQNDRSTAWPRPSLHPSTERLRRDEQCFKTMSSFVPTTFLQPLEARESAVAQREQAVHIRSAELAPVLHNQRGPQIRSACGCSPVGTNTHCPALVLCERQALKHELQIVLRQGGHVRHRLHVLHICVHICLYVGHGHQSAYS